MARARRRMPPPQDIRLDQALPARQGVGRGGGLTTGSGTVPLVSDPILVGSSGLRLARVGAGFGLARVQSHIFALGTNAPHYLRNVPFRGAKGGRKSSACAVLGWHSPMRAVTAPTNAQVRGCPPGQENRVPQKVHLAKAATLGAVPDAPDSPSRWAVRNPAW